jgi:hypothetical protein
MKAELALAEAGEVAFTILGPGESIDVSHDCTPFIWIGTLFLSVD